MIASLWENSRKPPRLALEDRLETFSNSDAALNLLKVGASAVYLTVVVCWTFLVGREQRDQNFCILRLI
jgi:hypothetical protein